MNKKNIIKKIITGSILLALVLLEGIAFVPGKAFAAAPVFNNDPQDKSTLRMINRTQGGTTWQDNLASAKAGDKIAFDVYYHNTASGTTATNTKIRLDFEDNKDGKLKFHAFLWADNANYVDDLGTITVPCSGLAFEFDKTALWYPNQSATGQNITPTFNQSNSIEVNIGSIAGGWQSQGHIVFEGTILRFTPKFNFMENDKETLRLKNRTQGTTEWQDPISANPGDTISFDVYYHNGIECSIARNTKISIEFPTEPGNKIQTVGIIEADNATSISDYGTIQLGEGFNEKLTFKTTALWYPNQSAQGQSRPVTISGNRATVNIGDIEGCWPYQGHIVFEADLSLTPTPLPTPKPAIPTPTTAPPGQVLGSSIERTIPIIPTTGVSTAIALSLISSILGYSSIAKKKTEEKFSRSKLQKAITEAKKRKGL